MRHLALEDLFKYPSTYFRLDDMNNEKKKASVIKIIKNYIIHEISNESNYLNYIDFDVCYVQCFGSDAILIGQRFGNNKLVIQSEKLFVTLLNSCLLKERYFLSQIKNYIFNNKLRLQFIGSSLEIDSIIVNPIKKLNDVC